MKLLMIPGLILVLLFLSSCGEAGGKPAYKPVGKSVEISGYKLGIHPYLNSKKMYTAYRPILDLIEKKIGNIEIILETSANYSEYNKKLYRGDFDISLPNPFQTYNALTHEYKVIARMKPDSVFRGIFVARKDSHIKRVEQLRGKTISFPAPTALAATMMPLLYLHDKGLDVSSDIKKVYVGSQYSSILNAYVSNTIMGATWPPPWESWKKDNPEKAEMMEVVWQTESLINNGLIVKKGLDPQLVQQLIETVVGLDTTPQGKELLNKAGFEGFSVSKDSDYDQVADFLRIYDKKIGIPK